LGRGIFDVQPFWRGEMGWGKAPAVDIVYTDKADEITAELPGMDESNIDDDQRREEGRKGGKEEGLLPFRTSLRLVPAVIRSARWSRR
jgi:hypothetical protein